MAQAQEPALPRMPFTTPIMHQKAYKEPAKQTPAQKGTPQPSSATQGRSGASTLNIMKGFDNPRTPPAPGHGFEKRPKHTRQESLQERRAAKLDGMTISVDTRQATAHKRSSSHGTLLIGFDQAMRKLNMHPNMQPTAEKKLHIEIGAHIISPIAPSIIVTGIPPEGDDLDNMFLKPVDPRHRSSIYSQATHFRNTPCQRRDSIESAPPVPVIPYDLLDPTNALSRTTDSSRVTSWNTDLDDDDHSVTYVGSIHPAKDDMEITLLKRTDTVATKHRSDGWWNTITTPFMLQRSATLKSILRSPAAQSFGQSSPQPPSTSGSGRMLSEANINALSREADNNSSGLTTPHIADGKRATIAFFADATPLTATFPPVPSIHEQQTKNSVMSPEFVEPGGFGEAAEYFEACWHDMTSPEPFYPCVNHDCNIRHAKDAIADARSRELFQASIAVDRANKTLEESGLASNHASGGAKTFGEPPAVNMPDNHKSSPSLVDHVQPSDSVSCVAERKAVAWENKPRGVATEIPNNVANRETMFSDSIGSPQVVEATAVPIIRAVTPEPKHLNESMGASGIAQRPRAGPALLPPPVAPAQASVSAQREVYAPVPIPIPSSLPSSVPHHEEYAEHRAFVPPPGPPPPIYASYPEASRGLYAAATLEPANDAPRSMSGFEPANNRAVSPVGGPASGPFQSPMAVGQPSSIGMARSTPLASQPTSTQMPFNAHERSLSPPLQPISNRERATALGDSNHELSRRQLLPPIAVRHSPNPQENVSPGALTPGMARDAQIGNAVPMQPAAQGDPQNAAPGPNQPPGFTHRAVMERYNQRHSPPNPNDAHTQLPAPVFMPPPHQDPFQDPSTARGFNEKNESDFPPRPPKKPSKLGMIVAAWKTGRAQRPPKTKEQKRKRRCCCLIFSLLFAMVLAIVLCVMLLTIPRADMAAQSSWLNLTNYPPIPTGIATVARPNNVRVQNGCVQPQTMWSCAVPREQQDAIKPNAADQPNFRFLIRFQNGTTMSNGTTASTMATGTGSNGTASDALARRDAYSASLWNPNPAPPSEDDQIFIGNTTDHNSAPYDGEETPFWITFLPITSGSGNFKRDDSSSDISSNNAPVSSAPASTGAAVSRTSSSPTSASASSSGTSDPFPDLTAGIPSPAVNPDGSPSAANLYPLPSAQPLRLYNRNKPDEHYGFYTYYDRSIFLSAVTLANTTLSETVNDVPGGSPASSALQRCTWSQTRFLIQIWTGGPNGAGNQGRMLLNGSSTASAAASGNITANSANSWSQPGSFPYPVTVTVDRHGGSAKDKMVYCYGLSGGKVNLTAKTLSFENRTSGGTIIGGVGGFLTNATDKANTPIDGGTGGCGCVWQNWQTT